MSKTKGNKTKCKKDHDHCRSDKCKYHTKYPMTDYIVIGAGAAGNIIAARLADAGYTVRVLEAGPDTSPNTTDPDTYFDSQLIKYTTSLEGFRILNRFYKEHESCNCGFWQPSASLLDFVTEPQEGGHKYAYPRAAGAGGCVSHHGMVDGIGSLEIYDNIAEKVGDNYWLGSNVKTLFNKMENFQPLPDFPLPPSPESPICPGGQAPGHGYNGWLFVKPIDKIEELNEKIVKVAVNDFGITSRPDFGTGSAGIGPAQYTMRPDGSRSNSYVDLLMPVKERTGRIEVNFNTLVDKIVLSKTCHDKENDFRATCVKAYEKKWLQYVQTGGSTFTVFGEDCRANRPNKDLPKPTYFYARKEIIVSGGAVQSPTILMRSGIGPKCHLKDMDIKCKLDRSGVGSDIMDHTEMPLIFEIDPRKYIPRSMATDYYRFGLMGQVEDPVIMKNINDKYEFEAYSYGSSLVLDWCSGVGGVDFPDVHAVFSSGLWFDFNIPSDLPFDPDEIHDGHPTKDLIPDRNNPIPFSAGLRMKREVMDAQYDPKQVKTYFHWLIEHLVPGETPGTIRLRSKDVRDEPVIDEKLYMDDVGLERMARMALKIREIMNHPNIKEYGMPEYEFRPGPKVQTVEDMKEYIKNWFSFGHHISGGCQMSKPGIQNGVVSSQLKVFGVSNLRVADTSVYPSPWLHGYNTARGAYLIGEACADLILNH